MATLEAVLANHSPADEKERVDLESMRSLASSLAQPFSREQWPAHFTGSAVVVTPEGDRVCLVLHAKLQRWLQPGGHADVADGGSMEATALREAREETGCDVALHPTAPRPLDVDVHVIPARKTDPEHRHLDVRYLVIAKNPEALAFDPNESHGAQWLTWDEALARADEAPLKRMLEKARRLSLSLRSGERVARSAG
jgi:8-oxo-dGTP pyrophosphatase MutT (NUDIX family)